MATSSASEVNKKEEWVIGPETTPFFTITWTPKNVEPVACVLFIHGFSEHIARYDSFFTTLASPPYNLRITAFDQRGHGRTSYTPLLATSPEVLAWGKEGKVYKLEKNGKRRTGGWGKALPDIEWFLLQEAEVAKSLGKKLFLWGFSMGGGQVLGFCTRSIPPPKPSTMALLSGVVVGGALVKLANAAPKWKLWPGSTLANLGFGDMTIDTPSLTQDLSHDPKIAESVIADPWAEHKGSLRGLSDMINMGEGLLAQSTYSNWPKDLPLLMYHAEQDKVTDPRASKEFYDKVDITDKHYQEFKGLYHEIHNEYEPAPTELAKLVGEWINTRAAGPTSSTTAANAEPPAGHPAAVVESASMPEQTGQSKL